MRIFQKVDVKLVLRLSETHSSREVGRIVGCSLTTVRDVLKAHGVVSPRPCHGTSESAAKAWKTKRERAKEAK